MISKFIIISFAFLASAVAGCFFGHRIQPVKLELEIDQPRFRVEAEYYSLNHSMKLRKLYEMVEYENYDNFYSESLFKCFDEIFEFSGYYIYTPAEWAIIKRKQKVFELFFKFPYFGVVPFVDSTFKKLILTALKCGNLEAFKFLTKYPFSFSLFGHDLLFLAAQHFLSEEFLQYLLDDCNLIVEINSKSEYFVYDSPISTAIKFNNIKCTALLLARGASLIRNDPSSTSPLHTIISLNRQRILQDILKNSKSVCKIQDSCANTLLHYVSLYGTDAELVSLVLEECPETNLEALNDELMTPLDIILNLTDPPKVSIAIALISSGSDVFLNSYDGLYPYEIIIQNRFTAIFNYLIKNLNINDNILQKFVKTISREEAWSFLDIILKIEPDLPLDFIDFKGISFDIILYENAPLSFKLFLTENCQSNIPIKILNQIISSGMTEFMKIAIEFGADLDHLDKNVTEYIQKKDMKDLIEEWKISSKSL